MHDAKNSGCMHDTRPHQQTASEDGSCSGLIFCHKGQWPRLGWVGADVDASALLLRRSASATALTADDGLAAALHPQSDSPVR